VTVPVETIRASIYDFPKYYDLLFGSDCQAEYHFIRGCFERHAGGPVRRVFEPACGTGRLLVRFARAGYEVAGLPARRRSRDALPVPRNRPCPLTPST